MPKGLRSLLDALLAGYDPSREWGGIDPVDPMAPYQGAAGMTGIAGRYGMDAVKALGVLGETFEKAYRGEGYDPVQDVTVPLLDVGMGTTVVGRAPAGSLGSMVGKKGDKPWAGKLFRGSKEGRGRGRSFTTDPEYAKAYGDKIVEAQLTPEAKVLDLTSWDDYWNLHVTDPDKVKAAGLRWDKDNPFYMSMDEGELRTKGYDAVVFGDDGAVEIRVLRDDPSVIKRDMASKTDTPEFRKWFGESKVVDEAGEPLVVYHGTDAEDFDIFKTDRAIYFTDSKEYASAHGKNVKAYYLKIEDLLDGDKNPKAFSALEDYFETGLAGEALDRPYTGGVNSQAGYREFIVESPEQVKSIKNRGTFDPNDPNVLRGQVGAPVPTQEVKEGQLRDALMRRLMTGEII